MQSNSNISKFSEYQEYEGEEVKIQKSMAMEVEGGWKDLMLKPQLMKAIEEAGFRFPSDVQKQGIVEALSRKNILCEANSGTGKTAVFVLTLLQLIQPLSDNTYMPHQALILVPTRQLVHQLLHEFKRFGKYINPPVPISGFFGGIQVQKNVQQLIGQGQLAAQSPAIIIATTGRLYDLFERKYIILENIHYFIVDEFDKILDSHKMRGQFIRLHQSSRKDKLTFLFSATLNQGVWTDVHELLPNIKYIKISDESKILNRLTHYYIHLPEQKKYDRLERILEEIDYSQCIIFVNKIEKSTKLIEVLSYNLFNPLGISSAMKQQQRIINYDLFKTKVGKIIVATDVFGRGIDIQKVNLVINYDFPYSQQSYLHRVGRAGRFGSKGIAINFLSVNDGSTENNDDNLFSDLQRRYKIDFNQLPDKMAFNVYV